MSCAGQRGTSKAKGAERGESAHRLSPRTSLRTRREVLVAGMAGAFTMALAACGGETTRKAAGVAPGRLRPRRRRARDLPHEREPFVRPLLRVVQGRARLRRRPGRAPGAFAQAWPGGAAGQLLPFHLDTADSAAECTFDLSHEWSAQHQCWNNGQMDRFVATHTPPQFEGPHNGVLTMGYYTRADLDFWYSLADAFTICDGYHCSVMGPTHPNRLHAWSGTLDPDGQAGGPVIITNSESERHRQRVMAVDARGARGQGRLVEGVQPRRERPTSPSSPLSIAISDNILLYFKRHVKDPSSPLYKKAFGPIFPGDFATRRRQRHAARRCRGSSPPLGYDEHPPSPPAAGEWFTHQVLSALVSNPKVWAKTVLFVMYDENDGFFDHVAPPVPPPGTPGEYLTVRSRCPLAARAITGPDRPRLPGAAARRLAVQPRRLRVLGHLRPHLAAAVPRDPLRGEGSEHLGLAAQGHRRPDLDAARRPRPTPRSPTLPVTRGRSDAGSRANARPLQLIEVDVTNPAPYPVPADQTMPSQEPGAAVPVPT